MTRIASARQSRIHGGRAPGAGDGPARGGEGTARHAGMALLTGAIAASAYAGGLGLIAGFLPLGAVVTSRLPFASPVLGGIALMAVVAIPHTVACWFAAAGGRRCGDATVLAGLLLVGWIVVELAFIRQLSFFHPLFLVLAGLVIWLGSRVRPLGKPDGDVL